MARAKKLTIKEIANEAGVSITTASFVINGNDKRYGIKQATVDKVKAVIAKHRYQPNFGAQIMKTGRSDTVAFLAPSITDGFYNRIVVEIEKAAQESGYKLILGNTLDSLKTEVEYIENLIHRQIDGVVIVPVDPAAEHLKLLKENGVSSVLFSHPDVTPSGYYCVDFDLNHGMYEVMDHLVEKGCSRIALLDWLPAMGDESSWSRLRNGLRASYDERLKAHKLVRKSKNLVWTLFGESPESSHGAELIRLIESEKPEAIVAMRSEQIHRAWRYLAQAGIRVPDDIRLVACDDKPANRDWYPSISAVPAPKEDLGRYMLEQVLLKKRKRGSKLFKVGLEVRESSR